MICRFFFFKNSPLYTIIQMFSVAQNMGQVGGDGMLTPLIRSRWFYDQGFQGFSNSLESLWSGNLLTLSYQVILEGKYANL